MPVIAAWPGVVSEADSETLKTVRRWCAHYGDVTAVRMLLLASVTTATPPTTMAWAGRNPAAGGPGQPAPGQPFSRGWNCRRTGADLRPARRRVV